MSLASDDGQFLAAAWGARPDGSDEDVREAISRRGQFVAVGMARIDDRRAVLQALGKAALEPFSDLDVLVFAYERWGLEFASRVDGDYAAVLWDDSKRRLVGIRDAFGSIPLVYMEDSGSLFISADVEPIIRLASRVPKPDDEMVLDYLTQDFRDRSRTFFAGLRRVVPGYLLRAERGTADQHRYWFPPARELKLPRDEILFTYLSLLRRSTARQMRNSRNLVVEVSGGLDSSSVAALAVGLTRSSDRPRGCSLFHQGYPGLDCDEGDFATAMEAHLGVSIHRVTMSGDADPTLANGVVACPSGRAGLIQEYFDALQAANADVVLGGEGGDSLNYETGAIADLAVAGQWRMLARQLFPLPRYGAPRWRTWARIVGASVIPAPLRALRRRLRRRPEAPKWLGSALRRTWRERSRQERQSVGEGADQHLSNVQKATWNALTNPLMEWVLDSAKWMFRWNRIEVRHPFLDPALARFVLALPPQERLPNGLMKSLLRDSMGEMLPPLVRNRTRATVFNSYLEKAVQLMTPRISSVLLESPWRAEPYLPRDIFVRSLGADRTTTAEVSAHTLWLAASLELWLRSTAALGAEIDSDSIRSDV